MRRILLSMVFLFLFACDKPPMEDAHTGELRGLLARVPAGEKIFLDSSLQHLLPPGVQGVALPAALRGPREIAPGVGLVKVRLPHPPLVYADEVNYVLLPAQVIEPTFGCASSLWDPVGRSVGPAPTQFALWRRKPDLQFADNAKAKPSTLVTIPGGKALLGDAPLRASEYKAFAIEKTEVTYGQYAAFLSALAPPATELAIYTDLGRPENPIVREGDAYRVPADCAAYPAAFVSFAGAQAYCEHFNRRLPPTRLWEIAARGGGERTYPWGEDARVVKYANIAGIADGYQNSSPVGSFPQGASPHGLLDMAGNAFEWTAHEGAVCLRGGSWATSDTWVRCTATETNVPHARNNHNGFRCVGRPVAGPE